MNNLGACSFSVGCRLVAAEICIVHDVIRFSGLTLVSVVEQVSKLKISIDGTCVRALAMDVNEKCFRTLGAENNCFDGK